MTQQSTCCSLTNHCLQFATCVTSPARKRPPLTTTTTLKPSWGVNKKIKCASLSVVRLWGVLGVESGVHYDTLHEMKQSIVVPDARWSCPSAPDALRLPVWGRYRADAVYLTSAQEGSRGRQRFLSWVENDSQMQDATLKTPSKTIVNIHCCTKAGQTWNFVHKFSSYASQKKFLGPIKSSCGIIEVYLCYLCEFEMTEKC